MSNKVSFIIQMKDQFSRTAGKLQKQLKGAKKSADDLDKSLKGKLKASFSGINKSALNAAKGVATLGTAMATVRTGSQFEDAMAELSAITGAEGSKLRAMGDDVFRLAKKFGISQDIVAASFTQTASSKSELLNTSGAVAKVAASALLLSKAAGIDVPDAIRASVGALNQFGVGADQANRFINVIAAGSKVGASQVGETAEALKNSGTVAAQFGLSFEETNAILQVFAKNEIKGAEAGTKLRATLVAMEKMGGKFAPSVVGMSSALDALAASNSSNVKLAKDFGSENIGTALILRNNIPLIKQWTREMTGSSVASDQAGIRMDTFSTRVSKAGTALKSVAIKVFEGWEPVLSFFVDKFTFILNSIEGVTGFMGNLLGQTAGAFSSMDFGQFDFKSMASSFGTAFGEEKIPSTPSVSGGSLNGNINISAAPNTVVESTNMKTSGAAANIGLNVVTQ